MLYGKVKYLHCHTYTDIKEHQKNDINYQKDTKENKLLRLFYPAEKKLKNLDNNNNKNNNFHLKEIFLYLPNKEKQNHVNLSQLNHKKEIQEEDKLCYKELNNNNDINSMKKDHYFHFGKDINQNPNKDMNHLTFHNKKIIIFKKDPNEDYH